MNLETSSRKRFTQGFWNRIIRGSAFEAGGNVSTQGLRLVGNLILARLLFPEAFGLGALITVLNQGLVMLSDVGLRPTIIQNKRGDDLRFLNTAWTVQAIRGVFLYIFALGLAWPLAEFYDERLLYLVPIGSLQVLVLGLMSTSIITLQRRLQIGPVVVIDVLAQLTTTVVMIVYALISPTVWALVVGGLMSGVVKTAASHWLKVGYRNRFAWDREALSDILSFGRWIFGSSVLSFLGKQGDRLLLGRLLGVSQLGIYTIAVTLSDAIGQVVTRVTRRVLYPVFSEVNRENASNLQHVYYRARLGMDFVAMPALGLLAALGQPVVDLLYDARYAAAGWMLQVLVVRVLMSCMLVPCEMCLMAMSRPQYSFYQNLARTFWVLGGISVAGHFWGLPGVVWVSALSETPSLLIQWPALRRMGVLLFRREALALGFFFGGLLLGQAVARWVL